MTDPWIGVAEVAAEMNLTDRAAWEFIKQIGVRVAAPARARMENARFPRSEFESARERSMGALPPRAPYKGGAGGATPAEPAPAPRARGDRTAATAAASKLARLRGR